MAQAVAKSLCCTGAALAHCLAFADADAQQDAVLCRNVGDRHLVEVHARMFVERWQRRRFGDLENTRSSLS